MNENFGNGGQAAPAANTDHNLSTVSMGRQWVCGGLVICNTAATATTFRVAHRIGGAALTTAQYYFFDNPLAANQTVIVMAGMTLGAGDIITVRSGNGLVAFNLNRSEVTV